MRSHNGIEKWFTSFVLIAILAFTSFTMSGCTSSSGDSSYKSATNDNISDGFSDGDSGMYTEPDVDSGFENSSGSTSNGINQASNSSAGSNARSADDNGAENEASNITDTAKDNSNDSENTNKESSDNKNNVATDKNESGEKSKSNINTEKLIYRCNMRIDTMDFDNSVNNFKSLITKYNGFVENEKQSDNAYSSYDSGSLHYRIESNNKNYTYTATVRIPSSSYDKFVEESGNIGDLRNKDSNVENVTKEYSDLGAKLEVYKAKHKRYLELMKKAKTTSEILEVERYLTDIETVMNQVKSRMQNIDNDVAYSYVTVTITAVKEYQQPEEVEETFFTKIKNAFTGGLRFVKKLFETLAIVIVAVFPLLVILGIIAGIIIFFIKRYAKKHPERKKNKMRFQNPGPNNNFGNRQFNNPNFNTGNQNRLDNNTNPVNINNPGNSTNPINKNNPDNTNLNNNNVNNQIQQQNNNNPNNKNKNRKNPSSINGNSKNNK